MRGFSGGGGLWVHLILGLGYEKQHPMTSHLMIFHVESYPANSGWFYAINKPTCEDGANKIHQNPLESKTCFFNNYIFISSCFCQDRVVKCLTPFPRKCNPWKDYNGPKRGKDQSVFQSHQFRLLLNLSPRNLQQDPPNGPLNLSI